MNAKRGPGRPRKNINQNMVKSVGNASFSAPISASGDPLITMLELVAADDLAPIRDRTAAARTVLEARGLIGRHQQAPGDELARRPLSDMTRPQLEQELERLRQHFAARAEKITQSFDDLMG
jgi:hypothetical protein